MTGKLTPAGRRLLAGLFEPGPTRVMGVLNVTSDSFSDGGVYLAARSAIAHGRSLAAEGAAIVDVGGESTRPGAARVTEAEELSRVIPVVEALAADGIAVSVDTMRAEVARAGISAGAIMINDVSGGLADPNMLAMVSDAGAGYVAMHWRGHSDTMQANAVYEDVLAEVVAELADRRSAARAAGIEHLVLDPGIGFAKEPEHNWELLQGLDAFSALGEPLLIGVSRKRFLGELLSGRPAMERDAATAAVTAWCARERVWAVRTHEVRGNVDAIAVTERLVRNDRN